MRPDASFAQSVRVDGRQWQHVVVGVRARGRLHPRIRIRRRPGPGRIASDLLLWTLQSGMPTPQVAPDVGARAVAAARLAWQLARLCGERTGGASGGSLAAALGWDCTQGPHALEWGWPGWRPSGRVWEQIPPMDVLS